jgi:dethiobiotin synthetase
MHCFITGTSTDVGKTYVTRMMLRALVAEGKRAVGYKPIACGSRDDVTGLRDDGYPGPTVEEINPLFLASATAPHVASQLGNQPVDPAALVAGFHHLAGIYEHVLVEGAGGWEVPMMPGKTMADLAADLALPVVVVVDNRLGALNHTILTVNAIRARGLRCAGLILNHLQDERDTASITNRAILEDWLDLPVLQDILYQETSTDADWILDFLESP